MGTSLVILDGRLAPEADGNSEVLDLQAFVQWAYSGRWWRRLGRFGSVRLLTQSPQCLPRRWLLLLLLRLLSRGPCEIEGADGNAQAVTAASLLVGMVQLLRDGLDQGRLRRELLVQVGALEEACRARVGLRRLSKRGAPCYLKTDLWLGTPAGGSVGHMAGVVNQLGRFGPQPRVCAPSANLLIDERISFKLLAPPRRFWDFRETPMMAFNADVIRCVGHLAASEPISWIYQRYSLHNFAGLRLAELFSVPLVLEYNGSEVWAGEHWGSGLRYPALAQRIECLNLDGADLVVVVSEASRRELVGRGVDPEKILVNPNGVDIERYRPDVDGTELRQRLGLAGATVIGFIGTFGKWHGAEVLVEAFARVCRAHDSAKQLRLLLIGDGQTRQECEERARKLGVADRVVFTRLVPQADGPRWLAACDVLVAPHVPNVDGSAFFGSPTKLFEYLAMGRPVVASRLGQMAELLVHGQTAWLVEPGQPESLAQGLLAVLSDSALRERMCRQARREAIERHTWYAHTGRIVECLKARCV